MGPVYSTVNWGLGTRGGAAGSYRSWRRCAPRADMYLASTGHVLAGGALADTHSQVVGCGAGGTWLAGWLVMQGGRADAGAAECAHGSGHA